MSNRPHIAAYYFPEYHPDARNDTWHGTGWTEWELMKHAQPRFEGHHQPKIPVWGYEDESDPAVMEKKIAAAAEYGIDSFIFDWYWYEDGPFLERCLEQGFLKAKNNDRLKFSIMWANHTWSNNHPGHRTRPLPVLAPGEVSRKALDKALDHVIEHYFPHPSYWKLDGAQYFSFYGIRCLIDGLGGVEQTKDAIEDFRARTEKAGRGPLHVNAIQQSTPIDTREDVFEKHHAELMTIGFDSVAAYIWHWRRLFAHFPTTEYAEAREGSIEDWENNVKVYGMPYIPSVTMGWDNTPRVCQSDIWEKGPWNYSPVVINNTPEEFEKSLAAVRDFLARTECPFQQPVFTINAWNEWTEGNHLEPEERYGFGYLAAVRNVFGTA